MKTIFDRILLLLMGVALTLDGVALVDFLLHPLATDFAYHSIVFRVATILVLTPLTLLVGFLIIRRVPGNIVGPMLVLWSATVAFGALRQEIGPVPFALFGLYEIAIGWLALFMMVLHYPDGKIYPPAAAAWLYRLIGLTIVLAVLTYVSTTTSYGLFANPFSIRALQPLNGVITWLQILVGTPMMVLTVVSPVLRYRRGSYLERQQIKWLALFGGILSVGTVLGFIVYPLLTGGAMFSRENNPFSLSFFLSVGLFPPLVIGVAVLRYRLWDIDLIIRRTLVYSILTVVLSFIYFSSVVLLQELFQFFTSQHQSPVATVISTLTIAALFTPLRRRIQSDIDRRFYRRRYDAQKIMARFAASARDEVELDRLTADLVSVVQETMQPESVSLWLRGTRK